jgi:hypothetical protein
VIGLSAVLTATTLGAFGPSGWAQTSQQSQQRSSARQAQRESQGRPDQVNLDPGTVIPVTLRTRLSSNGSSPGDTFTANVDDSTDAYDRILRGATVSGVVRGATAREGDTPGTLELAFTSLRLSDGRVYPISGTLASLDTKALKTRSDGVLEAKNTNKDQHLAYAGIGAGAGALVGLLGDHKLKIEDILLGGLAGYAAGSVLKGSKQIHDVDLKPGTALGILLGNGVRYGYRRDVQSAAWDATNGRPAPYRAAYVASGVKHYWYHGQEWTMDLASGRRYLVAAGNADPNIDRDTYYRFEGHSYYRDARTGERIQTD